MLDIDRKTSTVTNSLDALGQNRIFWFLKKDRVGQVQHDLKTEAIILNLKVFSETLASDPEKKLNEDSYMILPFGVGRMLFAVLDGASSQKEITGLAQYGTTGAFYISHLVGFGFRESPEYQELSNRSTLSAGDIMQTVNKWILSNLQKVEGVDYDDVLTVPGMAATFALVDFNKGRVSIAHVADTVAAVVDENRSVTILTNDLDERFDRETQAFVEKLCHEYRCSHSQIHKIPEAKERINNQLIDSFRIKINTQGGCGILNGMPELTKNNLIFEEKIDITKKLSSLFLFSDGALLPYKEENASVKIAVERFLMGVNGDLDHSLLEQGDAILREDTELTRIPRLKLKDDATVLAIHFGKR